MRIFTTSAVALSAALLLGLAGTSPSFAKAHDQGLAKGNPAKEGSFMGGRPGRDGPGMNETAAAARAMNDDKGNNGKGSKSDRSDNER
jgi:hypothetical protein